MESSSSLLDEDEALLHDVSKLGDSLHRAKPSCSSPKDGCNKENINVNKSESQKLSLEPLQMKRKKKGGGYNLRKSLAWDRAFFTEEGVLDPLELSMITGTHVSSAGEGLSVISEEGSNLISGDCQFTNNSPNLKSHQKKKASHKLLTSHGGSGTGLNGGGCPRPSPSSSLKRPALLNAGRSATKESKFPKTAIRKPGPCSVPVTAKGTVPSGSSLKRNQIVQPAVKIQKSAESKIPTNVKNIPKSKAGSAAVLVKSSTKLSKINPATSPQKLPSSTDIRSQLVSKADKTCSKEILKDVIPLGTLCSKEDGSTPVIAPARHNTSTASSSMHRGQIQARKPSGLRMPSPSLGFFGQPKASLSNNLTAMSSGLITPGLSKLRDLRPSQALGGMPKMLHDITASLKTRLLSSRTECSATSHLNAVSHNLLKPALEENTKKLAVKLPHNSKHAEVTSNELAAHEFRDVNKKSEDHVKHDRHGRIVCKEDSDHQMNVTGLLQQTEVREHLMEADDIKEDIHGFQGSKDSNNSDRADSPLMSQKMFALDDPLGGENLCNTAVTNADTIYELQSGVIDSGRKHNMNIDGLNSDLVLEELRCENLSDSLHKESQNIEMDGSTYSPTKRMPDELQDSDLPNASSIVQDHSEGELKRSISLPHSTNVVPDNTEHKGDVILQSITGKAPADCSIMHTSLVHDHEKSEQQELANLHLEATIDSKCNNKLQMKDHSLKGKCSIFGQSMENSISGRSGGALPRKADVYKCESASSSDVGRVLCSLEETCNDTNKFHNGSFAEDMSSDFACVEDTQSESVIIAPLPEAHELLTDSQIKCDMQLEKEAKSSEFSSDSRTTEDNEICVNSSCAEHCSLGGDTVLSTGENSSRSQQDFDGLKRNTLSYEDKSTSLHEIDTSAGEIHHELNSAPCSTTDKNTTCPIKNSEKDLNKNNVRIILPRDVAPFSEEWLAAIEAAGEDILTMKSGAVQNSPPDKSQPEPSPWSPVRRRNNQIGPYDCTKFTNTTPSDPQ